MNDDDWEWKVACNAEIVYIIASVSYFFFGIAREAPLLLILFCAIGGGNCFSFAYQHIATIRHRRNK